MTGDVRAGKESRRNDEEIDLNMGAGKYDGASRPRDECYGPRPRPPPPRERLESFIIFVLGFMERERERGEAPS